MEPTERVEYEYGDGEQRRTAKHYKKSRRRRPQDEAGLVLSLITEYEYDDSGRVIREVDRKQPELTRFTYECYE